MAEKKKNNIGLANKFDGIDKAQIKKLAVAGWTDVQMSDFFGVTEQTWNNWKKKYPSFFESLIDWKIEADTRVERALYERACGYSHTDTKFATHEGKVTDAVEYTKHYPPDSTSCIFWLKNRRQEWTDREGSQAADNLVDVFTDLISKLPD